MCECFSSFVQQPNRALIKLLEKKKGATTHVDILSEVKQLLNEGADPNIRNKENYTMVQLAIRNGHNECLEALIIDGKAKLDKRGP